MRAVVVIPALNPDERLLALVEQIRRNGGPLVLLVDDGSGPASAELFEIAQREYGCVVQHHPKNLGKGAALKTGMAMAVQLRPGLAGVVTADADSQHSPEDILRLCAALETGGDALLLGTRDFHAPGVPPKNRWGNRITALVFRLGTGVRLPDTQTGLRGLPAKHLAFLEHVPGSGFEYEMNMLLAALNAHIPLRLLPVATLYSKTEYTTHFHPLRDSARVYGSLLKNLVQFALSSLSSSVVDLGLFALFSSVVFGTAPVGILAATVGARLCSGGFNFLLNQRWVFRGGQATWKQAARYFVLFCVQMLLSAWLVSLLSALPVPLALCKIVVDGGLFFLSYYIQHGYIFTGGPQAAVQGGEHV